MRQFILFSRQGQTSGNFRNLRDAGRLDLVSHCIISSFFLSHKTRKEIILHIILNGPPNPPLHLQIKGEELHDTRTDEETIGHILKNVLSGKEHPGFKLSKKSFQEIVKELSQENEIYVLEEKGENIKNQELKDNSVFIIGDQVGLPKKEELFVLRYGKKLSLGKTVYLAADCITIINYNLDNR